VQAFTLKSRDFSNGGVIPSTFTRDGIGTMPSFHWENVPEQAKSLGFVISTDDHMNFDYSGPFLIYSAWNLSVEAKEFEGTIFELKNMGGFEGMNEHRHEGMVKIGLDRGAPEKYRFELFALNSMIDRDKSGFAEYRLIQKYMLNERVLETTVLYGQYMPKPR